MYNSRERGRGRKLFCSTQLWIEITANCICEIHCIALNGFNLNSVHKLSSKEKKISLEPGFKPAAVGWETTAPPPPLPKRKKDLTSGWWLTGQRPRHRWARRRWGASCRGLPSDWSRRRRTSGRCWWRSRWSWRRCPWRSCQRWCLQQPWRNQIKSYQLREKVRRIFPSWLSFNQFWTIAFLRAILVSEFPLRFKVANELSRTIWSIFLQTLISKLRWLVNCLLI